MPHRRQLSIRLSAQLVKRKPDACYRTFLHVDMRRRAINGNLPAPCWRNPGRPPALIFNAADKAR